MVCSLGSGRMAVMARLLAGGTVSQSITEDVGHQKFAAQIICRELSEASEANLLDEKDMHVFGLKPMDDPLHLVCCNACKKPVKASQYVAHAELCRSLNSMQETTLELDGSMGQRKPPKKERKKLSIAHSNQSTLVGELERSESIDADDISVSRFQLDGKMGMNPGSFMEAKMNSTYADVTIMMDGSGVSPGNTNGSTSVILPPTKRFKMVAGQQLPLSDDIGTASAVSKLASTQDACPYRDSPKGAIPASEIPYPALKYMKSGQALECCLPIKDCPLPLATKVYYSQRRNRLRSDLSHLYYEAMASTEELCSDMRDSQHLPSLRKPDQILAQNSEVCLGNSVGCQPDGDFSNQLPVDNVPRPEVASVGLTRSKILLKPYSFAGNSGQSLRTMQQKTGSVHVI
ncbi:uncharacterized protein [Pyrus communis]|uniref:uncharacterized protein n=1 Tax=Pyrus communis TaxID=23211 RepID=UPI0035BF8351